MARKHTLEHRPSGFGKRRQSGQSHVTSECGPAKRSKQRHLTSEPPAQPNFDVGADAASEVCGGLETPVHQLKGPDGPHEMCVPIEAFGSGTLLNPFFSAPLDKTVGDLRQLVRPTTTSLSKARTVRLFVGHGGTELDNDSMILADSALTVAVGQPLVCFPVQWRDQDILAECGWDQAATTIVDSDGRIRAVTIEGTKLEGNIPTEVGELTCMKDLRLTANHLAGPVPTEVGNLSSITRLVLFDNCLSGPVPTELGRLAKLTELVLESNKLGGRIPTELCRLTGLRALSLADNKLTGPIPSRVGDLTKLHGGVGVPGLNFANNCLTGYIPSQIGQLATLTKLWLFNNKLEGSIPTELGQLTALTELHLYHNQLTGRIPTEIGQLQKLTQLELWNNDLTGRIPTEIGSLPSLKQLWLHNNHLNDTADFERAMKAKTPSCNVRV